MNHRLSHFFLKDYFALYLVILTLLVVFFNWLLLPTSMLFELVAENGFIESSTVVLYFLCLIITWLPGSACYSVLFTRFSVSIILFSMMARELDLHKSISGISMFKLRFWTGDYPFDEKVLSVAVILLILFSLYYLYRRFARSFYFLFKQRQNTAITLVTFLLVAFASKIIDRSLNVIMEITGWQASLTLKALLLSMEEYLELLLPVLIILLICQLIDSQSLALREKVPS